MGGDCSQKLLLRRGWHSSPGRSRSSDQYEIHNSIADRTSRGIVSPRPPAAERLCVFRPCFLFPSQFSVASAGQSTSFLLKPVKPGWYPVTATERWRSGAGWPAKLVPSLAATNRRFGRSRRPC
jgi:hypothetical protein